MRAFSEKHLISLLIGLFFAVAAIFPLSANVSAQSVLSKPIVARIVPEDIFPDMFIMVEGSGIYNGDERSYVIFSQDDQVLRTYSTGGGRLANGNWGENIRVPQGLRAGKCKVEVEIAGVRSMPHFINVTETAQPPKLSAVSAPIVNPGYFLWIEGEGFSDDQTLEMTDAEGQKFTKTITGVSTANNLDFSVPPTAYSGIAKFKVIENRNGTPQTSNEISFEIRSGAIPLLLHKNYLTLLARGQWLEINLDDSRPLLNATKIDFKLTQGKKARTISVTNFRRLYFEIPKDFKPGEMNIETRTWINDAASEWAKPAQFEIIKKPAQISFHSLENVPTKAEAMFKQDGETIGIMPIIFGAMPYVRFPENIRRGNLEIYNRFWQKDGFTEWKRAAKYDNFDLQTHTYNYHFNYDKIKSYPFNSFFERHFFENNPSKFYSVERGNNLVIFGNFYVESAADLQILLENDAQKIYLDASEHEILSAITVNIPKDIAAGNWQIWLISKENKIKKKIPIELILD